MTPKQTKYAFATLDRHKEALGKHGHAIGGIKSRMGVLNTFIDNHSLRLSAMEFRLKALLLAPAIACVIIFIANYTR